MTIKTQTNSVVPGVNGSKPENEPKLDISGLVLVCGNSPVSKTIANITTDDHPWRFKLVDDLCRSTDAIADAVSDAPTNRLVLALCQGEYSKSEVLSRSRRAGIQTFGTQIVEAPASSQNNTNKALAVTGIKGAIARSETFQGTVPENIKTTFAGAGEKISRRALFTIPPIEYRAVPTINRSACIAGSGCTQCETDCPHAAIKNVAGAVNVDSSACKSCGLCVAACPQRAVEFPSYSATEIESHAEAVMHNPENAAPNIAFACSKSANLPINDWQIVPVACAGMVPAAALLSTIASGANSVGIVRCVEECAQQSGDRINGRIDYAKNALERAGMDPNRIATLAAAESTEQQPVPEVAVPTNISPNAINIFGRSATSNAVLTLDEMSPNGIAPFTHPYSPIGVPIVNAESCTMCGTCSAVCPAGALTQERSEGLMELTLDAAKCIACSECVTSCPEVANGAIELSLETDVQALTAGTVILNSDQAVVCTKCDAQFTSQLTLQKLEQLLGDDYSHDLYGALCPDCRTLT